MHPWDVTAITPAMQPRELLPLLENREENHPSLPFTAAGAAFPALTAGGLGSSGSHSGSWRFRSNCSST
jgi:hypothetical protein